MSWRRSSFEENLVPRRCPWSVRPPFSRASASSAWAATVGSDAIGAQQRFERCVPLCDGGGHRVRWIRYSRPFAARTLAARVGPGYRSLRFVRSQAVPSL